MTDTDTDPIRTDEAAAPQHLVPVWLAALVLVLLVAVAVAGGFVLRGFLAGDDRGAGPVDLEIRRGEEAIAQSPEDPDLRLQLGFSYQQAARYDDALVQYDLALKYRPRDTAALYNSGIVLRELDRDEEAEEILWDVLEIEPTHVLAAKALGEYYAEREEYRSLLVAVKPVVETNESSADLQYLMGLAYENTGRPDWAETRYRLALTYYPDMQEAHDGLERLGVSP